MQKSGFFDGHKREDVVKYKKMFLEKIKALSPYFVKFDKNGLILSKKYLKDCKMG